MGKFELMSSLHIIRLVGLVSSGSSGFRLVWFNINLTKLTRNKVRFLKISTKVFDFVKI